MDLQEATHEEPLLPAFVCRVWLAGLGVIVREIGCCVVSPARRGIARSVRGSAAPARGVTGAATRLGVQTVCTRFGLDSCCRMCSSSSDGLCDSVPDAASEALDKSLWKAAR